MPGCLEMETDASEGLCNSLSGEDTDAGLSLDKFIDLADRGFIRRAVLPLALGNAADAVEILSAGYILSAFRQDGSPLTSTQKELLTAAVFVGMLIGGLIAGSAADRFGRRYCLLVSLTVNLSFGALSAAAPSIGWLIMARVCAGLGVGGSIPVVFTLGAELFPTRIRGVMVSVIASFWMVGSIFAATAAWIVLGDGFGGDRILPGGTWRHYALVAALPAATSLFLSVLFVPESPRFLAKAGRYEETTAVLRRVTNAAVYLPPEAVAKCRRVVRSDHSCADRWHSWMSSLGGNRYRRLSETTQNDVIEGRSIINVDEAGECFSRGSERASSFDSGFLRLVGPGDDTRLVRSTVVLVVVWFSISYGTYGVATWNNQLFTDIGLSNPYLCSFIYALSNLPGNLGSILLVEQVGRKRLLSASMALAAAAATLFAFGSDSGAGVVVSAACLFNAFSTCGWNALGVLSAEAFPTAARVSGMALVSAAGRLGSIAAQFVNGSLEDNVLLLLMVTSGVTLLGALAVLRFPRDTQGVSLEEPLPVRAL